MGVLLPRNLKMKPMLERHILRVFTRQTDERRVSRPEAATKIISAGLIFAKELMRSMPKKPSTVASFS